MDLLLATVAALLLSLGCSRHPTGTDPPAPSSARPGAGSIEPMCESGTAACRLGERLRFRIDASPNRRWLAVSAEPADAPASGRTWLLPGPDGVSPEIPPAPAAAVLPRAVDLGAPLRPGLYRLTILLFDHPPTRNEVTSGASASLRLFRALEIH